MNEKIDNPVLPDASSESSEKISFADKVTSAVSKYIHSGTGSFLWFLKENPKLLLLLKNRPSRVVRAIIALKWGFVGSKKALGHDLVTVLEFLEPNLHELARVLLSDKHSNIDELYESVQPILDVALNKTLGGYGICLKDIGLHKLLTKSYLKSSLFPIVMIVRDIPKFCASIKDKDFLGTIQRIKSQLCMRIEMELHSEVRKLLILGADGLYRSNAADPALVSQIKKIYNAIVYLERIITAINAIGLNPENGFKLEGLMQQKADKQVDFMTRVVWYLAMKDSFVGNLFDFYKEEETKSGLLSELDIEPHELEFINNLEQIITDLRQFQSSILEVDLPFGQIFSSELTKIFDVLSTSGELKDKLPFLGSISKYIQEQAETKAQVMGQSLGKGVVSLKGHKGQFDYKQLTHHLGLLPEYLDGLRQLIHYYGMNDSNASLTLSDAQKDKNQSAAIRLFYELTYYHDYTLLRKGISLAFPIRKEVLALRDEISPQLTHVNGAVREMVIYRLAQIKNQSLNQIVAESEKFELYFGLSTGILTKSLITKAKEIYQALVGCACYIVDLKEERPDLLQLDNSAFLSKRIEQALIQKYECEFRLARAEKAKHDLAVFFEPGEGFPFESFKNYVVEYNPRLSVLIDNALTLDSVPADHSFNAHDLRQMRDAVSILIDKDIATFRNYLNITEGRLAELPKQVKGALYALNLEKNHTILIINEPEWLFGTDELIKNDSKTQCINHQFINELSSLSPENRAELYRYHAIRLVTLDYAQNEIKKFLSQLSKPDWMSHSKKIDSIIKQYRVLQPYLVDSKEVGTFLEQDKSFIDLLKSLSKNKQLPSSPSSLIDSMKNDLIALSQYIDKERIRSKTRQKLFEHAHKKTLDNLNGFYAAEPLTLDSELVKRQDKWIRHQNLSRASLGMQQILLNLMEQFDPSLKLLPLKNGPDDIPFPEMEDDPGALMVPSQVSWIKRIVNVVHYMHSTFKYLESLDKDAHTKDIPSYFLKGPLIEGIYQIRPFVALTKAYQNLTELMNDPTGQMLRGALKSSFDKITQALQSLKPLYFINPADVVVDHPNSVNNKGLWYPLLALMVIPEHLHHVKSGKILTQEQAKDAQKRAKEVAQYIEEVTEKYQACNYFITRCFVLLKNSPYIMFKLKPELLEKLNRLREQTHAITLAELDEIQEILNRFLIETDRLESRFGLRAGLVSKPMRLIMTRLFCAFIEPLGLPLEQSKRLILNKSLFKKRLEENYKIQTEHHLFLESEQKSLDDLAELLTCLELFKRKINADEDILPEEKELFKERYGRIYPWLQSQKDRYPLSLNQKDKSQALDKFCADCFKEMSKERAEKGIVDHFGELKDVMYLVKHVHAAKKGNINTLARRVECLRAQAKSIKDEKKTVLANEGKRAVESSITYAINEEINKLCDKPVELVFLAPEYKVQLYKKLASKQQALMQQLGLTSITQSRPLISSTLIQEMQHFVNTSYQQMLHLEAIIVEINRFQKYCRKETQNPVFENNDAQYGTLNKKIDLLAQLHLMAINGKEPVENRIKKIQEEARKDTFYATFMAYECHFKWSWKGLKRFFLNLFHSIFNFFGFKIHPADIYNSLENAIKVCPGRSKLFHEKKQPDLLPDESSPSIQPVLT